MKSQDNRLEISSSDNSDSMIEICPSDNQDDRNVQTTIMCLLSCEQIQVQYLSKKTN